MRYWTYIFVLPVLMTTLVAQAPMAPPVLVARQTVERDGHRVTMRDATISLGDTRISADEAIWIEGSQEVELRGTVRIKAPDLRIARIALQPADIDPAAITTHSFLDLTVPRSEAEPRSQGGWGVGFGTAMSGRTPPQLPLRVRLAFIDNTALVLGEQLVSEITLTNTGSSPILLPWSPERGEVGGAFVLEAELNISLVLVNLKGQQYLLSGIGLRGSAERPGSLLELGPGQTATIRAPSTLHGMSDDRLATFLTRTPQTFNLNAVANAKLASGESALPVTSENSIPVTAQLALLRHQ